MKLEKLPVISLSPHHGETPAIPAAPEAVKSAVAPRDPLNDPKVLVKGLLLGSVETARCGKYPSMPKDNLTEISIKDRLAALQAQLLASGKMRKPNTKAAQHRHANFTTNSTEHARLPHPND